MNASRPTLFWPQLRASWARAELDGETPGAEPDTARPPASCGGRARGETARRHRRPARHADVLLLPRARLPEACVRVLPRARAACHSLVAPGLLAVMELLSLSPVALWLCLRSLAFSAVLLPLACCPPHEHMPLADEPFAFGCCVPQPSPSCLSHSCMSLSSPSRRLTCSVLMSLSPSAGAGHDGTQLACRISRPGASAARVVACVVLPSRIHGAESCACICVRERARVQVCMLRCGVRARSSAAELSSTMAAQTHRYRSKCPESMSSLPVLCPCSSVPFMSSSPHTSAPIPLS